MSETKRSETDAWTLSKPALEHAVLEHVEKIADRWKTSKKGEILSRTQLMDNVTLRISRSKYCDESLILNIFLENNESDSAQLELRRMGPEEWSIADRQINDDRYKGKGIMKAFVKAAERFVESIATLEKEVQPHRVFLETAQPNVFQVFEHLGYSVRTEDEDKARLLRDPHNFPEEVSVQNAWMDAKKTLERIELTNRDPYCFRRDALIENPQPLPKDAVRVTLEKFIKPKSQVERQIIGDMRSDVEELF